MNNIWFLRLQKLLFSCLHPRCWGAIRLGVAPSIEHQRVLANIDFDLLLDVGANRGQFSLMAKLIHPDVPVYAYEPLPNEAAVYRLVHDSCLDIKLHQMALGDQEGTADIHISARADSSSLLPIGEKQRSLFPETSEVGVAQVRVSKLDGLPEHWDRARQALLKLDVQGFELNVLRGARAALTHCKYVYVECSEVQLYSGQALRSEVETFLKEQGFSVQGRYNEHVVSGSLIQADYLFGRC